MEPPLAADMPPTCQTDQLKFSHQRYFIGGFQQAWTKLLMYGKCTPNYFMCPI